MEQKHLSPNALIRYSGCSIENEYSHSQKKEERKKEKKKKKEKKRFMECKPAFTRENLPTL